MNRVCGFYRELVCDQDWLDDAEMRLLQRHLDECVHCRAEFELVQRIGGILHEDALPEVPAGLTDRIMAGVRADAVPVRASVLPGILLGLLLIQVPFLVLSGPDVLAIWARVAGAGLHWCAGLLGAVPANAAATLADVAAVLPAWLSLPAGSALISLLTMFVTACAVCGLLLYTEGRDNA